MILARHALTLLARNPRRSATTMVGTALATALVAAVLLFGIASETTVTRRALGEVPVDAQVVLAPGADPATVAATVSTDPVVRRSIPFDLVHFDTADLTAGGSATQTSAGVVVGLDPAYSAATGWFGIASGSTELGQMAISRDLSSNLGATAGDTITIHLPGGASAPVKVSGIVDTTGADLVLGPLDANHRAAGANPPANVAVMSLADVAALVAKVPAGATATDPSAAGPGTAPGASGSGGAVVPVFANEPAVRREIHLQIDHASVPGDPAAALTWLDGLRRRLDRQGVGAFQVIDDATAAIEPVAPDLAWGQILFLFLSLPGVLVALGLEQLAAAATRDFTRRHTTWLRTHGATQRDLLVVLAGSTALAALAGAVVGFGLGAVIAVALFGTDLWAAGGPMPIVEVGVGTVIGMTILGTLAAALPLRAELRRELQASRGEIARSPRPAWQRFYLDAAAIAGGVVAMVLIPQVRPVLNTEGVATVSLTVSAFVGPCLIWIGASLLLIRLAAWVAGRRVVASGLRRLAGVSGELAGASLATRTATVGPLVVVIALATSFAFSVLVFDATYLQQQRVDARLTLGADLKATPTAPSNAQVVSQLSGPGVVAATPFVDRIVYVGPEAQDLLAVDSTQLPRVAPLADSFFAGLTADQAMSALRSQPDGILVSAETARDYSIVPGDRVRIRVPDATGTLKPVDFRMVGVALEFPTAPKDAFLVANLDFVRAQTGNDRISFVLASAKGDPADAGRRLTTRLGGDWQVTDLTETTARIASEVTSVDLARLVLVDVAFALVIATVGIALFLLAAFADRSRELATLSAIGAEPRQVVAAIATESGAIIGAGGAAGVIVGLLIGAVLVQILTGVFDPAPTSPAIPIVWLAVILALTIAGGALAVGLLSRRIGRLDLVSPLRVR